MNYVYKNIYSVLYTSNLLFFVTALLPMSRNHDSLQIPDMSKCLLTDTKSHLPRERRCKKHIIRQVSITIKSMKKGFHSFCNGNILINKSNYICIEKYSSYLVRARNKIAKVSRFVKSKAYNNSNLYSQL